MKVSEIYNIIDRYAPFKMAMSWDNVGLLVGHSDAPVRKVLVTLDADKAAMQHALAERCELIVSHHPFFFDGERQVSDESAQGRKILFAIENHLNIICAHTNLDSCEGGINDTLGTLLCLKETDKITPANEGGYLARVGTHNYDSPEQFLSHAAKVLGVTPRFYLTDKFERIAWSCGSGSSCMDDAIAAGADTLVTGDCKYSTFMNAKELGIGLIDLGHFETEQIIVPVLANYLRTNGLEVVEHITSSPIQIFGE